MSAAQKLIIAKPRPTRTLEGTTFVDFREVIANLVADVIDTVVIVVVIVVVSARIADAH